MVDAMKNNVILDTSKIEIEEIYPYTRSGKNTVMQPTIVLRDTETNEYYYLCGMKVLYSLMNQLTRHYYRTTIKDYLYNGPTGEFIDLLAHDILTYKGVLSFNLCTPKQYIQSYGRKAMVNTRTPATEKHNIVQTVSSVYQNSTVDHIMSVAKTYDVHWDFVGTSAPNDGHVKATTNKRSYPDRVCYKFQRHGPLYNKGQINITLSPTGTMMAEVWFKHPTMGYEISPFDSLLKMTEQDARWLGPWLQKIDEALEYAYRRHEPTLAKETWDREVRKFEGTASEIGSTRRMLWRNKALKYSFGGLR
jgi:hypothetical protein